MKVCAAVAAAVAMSSAASMTGIAQRAFRTLTIEQAVNEAVDRNPGLLAERAHLAVAEAGLVTAALRPNPVLTGGANSLDWLGTGFNEINGAGPPEYAVRVDV